MRLCFSCIIRYFIVYLLICYVHIRHTQSTPITGAGTSSLAAHRADNRRAYTEHSMYNNCVEHEQMNEGY
jgi:hypothetical protein